jgi:hypothetical protein
MPDTNLHIMLGEVRGELKALRAEHDRHAESASENFRELRASVNALTEHRTEARAKASTRHGIIEAIKWAAMLAAAAFTGHMSGGH